MVELESVFAGDQQSEMMYVNGDLITRLDPMPTRFLHDGMEETNCLLHMVSGGNIAVVETREEIIGMLGREGITVESHYSDSDPRAEEIYPDHILFCRAWGPEEEDTLQGVGAVLGVRPNNHVAVTETVDQIEEKIAHYHATV